MSRLLNALSLKFKSIVKTISKDIFYFILIGFIFVVLSVSYYCGGLKDKPQVTNRVKVNESTADISPNDQIVRLIKEGHITPQLKMVLFVLFFGAIGGGLASCFYLFKLAFVKRRESIFEDNLGNTARPDVSYGDELYDKGDNSSTALLKYSYHIWNLWDVCKVIIIFFSSYIVFNFMQSVCIHLFNIPRTEANYLFFMILDMLFAEIVAIFFMFRILHNDYQVSFREFGIRLKNFAGYFLKGVSVYFMFLPLYFLINIITLKLSKYFGISLQSQEIIEMLAGYDKFSSNQLFVMIVFISVLGPFFEEVFFRGFLYRALKKHIGIAGALIVSSLLFALIHNNIMAFMPIFALGVILGVLLEKTGSLVPCVAMHIMVNSMSVALLFSLPKIN